MQYESSHGQASRRSTACTPQPAADATGGRAVNSRGDAMAVRLPVTPHPRLSARLAALPLMSLHSRPHQDAHAVMALRTERLRMRLVNASDVPELQAHWSER